MTVYDGHTQHEFAAGRTLAIIGMTVKEGGCYAYASHGGIMVRAEEEE